MKINMHTSNSICQLSNRQQSRKINIFYIYALIFLLNFSAHPTLALADNISLSVAGVSELKISALESELAKANLIGYSCIIDRSNKELLIKEKIISQVKLEINTFKNTELPDKLKKINPIKPGSRNLSK